jgi:hypothetical protein
MADSFSMYSVYHRKILPFRWGREALYWSITCRNSFGDSSGRIEFSRNLIKPWVTMYQGEDGLSRLSQRKLNLQFLYFWHIVGLHFNWDAIKSIKIYTVQMCVLYLQVEGIKGRVKSEPLSWHLVYAYGSFPPPRIQHG